MFGDRFLDPRKAASAREILSSRAAMVPPWPLLAEAPQRSWENPIFFRIPAIVIPSYLVATPKKDGKERQIACLSS